MTVWCFKFSFFKFQQGHVGCSFDKHSLKRALEVFIDVAREGEDSGYGELFLLIAFKNDLHSYPLEIKDEMVLFYLFILF